MSTYQPTSFSNLQGALSLWYTKANAGSAGATELAEANNYQGTGTGSDYQGNPNTWDVTLITSMNRLFKDITNIASYTVNPEISNWDVSQVTTMNYMFSNARSFNGDISSWNVSQVTNMGLKFQNAFVFPKRPPYEPSPEFIYRRCVFGRGQNKRGISTTKGCAINKKLPGTLGNPNAISAKMRNSEVLTANRTRQGRTVYVFNSNDSGERQGQPGGITPPLRNKF